jgi:hypothetical protein
MNSRWDRPSSASWPATAAASGLLWAGLGAGVGGIEDVGTPIVGADIDGIATAASVGATASTGGSSGAGAMICICMTGMAGWVGLAAFIEGAVPARGVSLIGSGCAGTCKQGPR